MLLCYQDQDSPLVSSFNTLRRVSLLGSRLQGVLSNRTEIPRLPEDGHTTSWNLRKRGAPKQRSVIFHVIGLPIWFKGHQPTLPVPDHYPVFPIALSPAESAELPPACDRSCLRTLNDAVRIPVAHVVRHYPQPCGCRKFPEHCFIPELPAQVEHLNVHKTVVCCRNFQ